MVGRGGVGVLSYIADSQRLDRVLHGGEHYDGMTHENLRVYQRFPFCLFET